MIVSIREPENLHRYGFIPDCSVTFTIIVADGVATVIGNPRRATKKRKGVIPMRLPTSLGVTQLAAR